MKIAYRRQAFDVHNRSAIEEEIKRRGFDPILINDPPAYRYPPHEHPETKLLVFLKGAMQVTVEEESFQCGPGDELIIPGNQTHSALTGSEGCSFYWSEKL